LRDRGSDGEEREQVDFAPLARIPAGAYVHRYFTLLHSVDRIRVPIDDPQQLCPSCIVSKIFNVE